MYIYVHNMDQWYEQWHIIQCALQRVAVCCSVLQCVAVRCSNGTAPHIIGPCHVYIHLALQCVAACCSDSTVPYCTTLHHIASHCNTLRHTAAHCYTLHHSVPHCSTLQHTATHCNTPGSLPLIRIMTALQHTTTHSIILQHTAAHCSTLQHSVAHCNTLQHTATHCNTPGSLPLIWIMVPPPAASTRKGEPLASVPFTLAPMP